MDDRFRANAGSGRSVFQPRRLADDNRFQQASRALDLVRDSVVALDSHGRITYINHAAEQLHGLTSIKIIGRVARTTLFPDSKHKFDSAWREVLATGEWRGEMTLGNERVVETRWSGVRDRSSSSVTSVLIVSTETSNTKLTAANLAHEIRNPLAGIKGVADAFLQGHKLTRREREWMEAVRHEVMKIDARIRELLDVSYSRVFNTTLCSLSDLISRVVVLATHQLQSITDRTIVIEFIDTTAEPVVMLLDSARIEDALLNLVLNAIESIDGDGRVTVCLRYRCTNGGEEALIEVTDTGCGIPPEIRKRIFEPLFTSKREGTGLGLAAVRRTAAAYHGRITFKTRVGRGSTFLLSLPIRSQPNLAENVK